MATKNATLKDYRDGGWDILHVETNMNQVEGLNSKLSEVEAIARGAARARVFDSLAALDAWLAVAGNRALLQIGDNLYIRDTDVPDYWWDGTSKQELETSKVALELATSTNDGLMPKGDKSKLDGIEAGATRVTAAGDIGAATSAQGAKADTAYQKPGTGIPKSDLASAVQTSLTKADSALQSIPDATASVKGAALLGASGGAARYGQKADAGLGNVQNTDTTNASNITSGTLNPARLGISVTTVGPTAPASPKTGDLWFDTND